MSLVEQLSYNVLFLAMWLNGLTVVGELKLFWLLINNIIIRFRDGAIFSGNVL